MAKTYCRECGCEAADLSDLCADCERSHQRIRKIEADQWKRFPLALLIGSLGMVLLPLAVLFHGPTASGSYTVTNRGKATLVSPEAIIGALFLALVIVGIAIFVFFRSKRSGDGTETLHITTDPESNDNEDA